MHVGLRSRYTAASRHILGPRAPLSTCRVPFPPPFVPQVVLGTSKAKASTPDILAVHCIAADRSPDLMQGAQEQQGGQSGAKGQANGPAKDGEGAGAAEAEGGDGGEKGKEKDKGAKGGKGGKAAGKAKR